MFDLVARMYRTGKIDEAGVQAAVARGWITQDQADEIIDSGGNVGVLVATTAPAPVTD